MVFKKKKDFHPYVLPQFKHRLPQTTTCRTKIFQWRVLSPEF